MTLSSFARGHLAMLAFSALIGGSFSFGSRIANLMDPMTLNALRFLIAAIVVGLMAAATGNLKAHYARGAWRYAVLGGLFAAYFVLMFEGLKTAAPVSASAVFTLTPLMTAVFGYIVLSQITGPAKIMALLVGAVGATWVIFDANLAALLRFDVGRGEAIYFIGCIAHALYTPMVRRLNRGEPAIAFTFGMSVAAFAILACFTARDLVSAPYASFPPFFWVALAYLAIFSSAMTFLLLQYATMHLPSANVMAYTYLTPSWVILWEIAFGQPLPAPVIWGGVAITVVALVMLLRQR